jgi:hypothetical protein
VRARWLISVMMWLPDNSISGKKKICFIIFRRKNGSTVLFQTFSMRGSAMQGCQNCSRYNIPKPEKYRYQMTTTYTEWPWNLPNYPKIYQHFPLQGTRNETQNVFVMKIYHLATLLQCTVLNVLIDWFLSFFFSFFLSFFLLKKIFFG